MGQVIEGGRSVFHLTPTTYPLQPADGTEEPSGAPGASWEDYGGSRRAQELWGCRRGDLDPTSELSSVVEALATRVNECYTPRKPHPASTGHSPERSDAHKAELFQHQGQLPPPAGNSHWFPLDTRPPLQTR